MEKREQYTRILRELRNTSIYPPTARQIEQFLTVCSTINSFSSNKTELSYINSAINIHLYKIANQLHELLEQENKNDITTNHLFSILNHLIATNLTGRNLAAELLAQKNFPTSLFSQYLQSISQLEQINVSDRIIAGHEDLSSDKKTIVTKIIAKAAKLDLEQSVEYFEKYGIDYGQVSLLTIDKFLNGKYGKSCIKILHDPRSFEELNKVINSIPPNVSPSMIALIVDQAETKDPFTTENALNCVLRTAQELDDEIINKVVALTYFPSIKVKQKALDVLIKFGHIRRGRIFSKLFNENKGLRAEIINRLPLFDMENLNFFLKSISKEYTKSIYKVLFSALKEASPFRFRNCLSITVKKNPNIDIPSFKKKIPQHIILPPSPTPPPQLVGEHVDGEKFCKKTLNSFNFNLDKKVEIEESSEQKENLIYNEAHIESVELISTNKENIGANNLILDNVSFTNVSFVNSSFFCCRFQGCIFNACNFSTANISECEFINCTFVNTSFKNGYIYDSAFINSNFESCSFEESNVSLSLITKCHFLNNTNTKSKIIRATLSSNKTKCCDFSATEFINSSMKGMNFTNCDFTKTIHYSSKLYSCEFNNCNYTDITAHNIETDSPLLLQIQSLSVAKQLSKRNTKKNDSSSFESFSNDELKVVSNAIKLWFSAASITKTLRNFLFINDQRLKYTKAVMTTNSRNFLYILPALITTSYFDQAFGINRSVPLNIANFTPTPMELEVLANFFPDVEYHESNATAVEVDALMSIGSLGSIAQTKSSDLDLWLCCDFKNTSQKHKDRIQKKLSLIEKWAMEELDVEVHFFMMDTADVRVNNFGLSDQESSGSAQSALLKEEFYRTTLLIAGKPPVWWFAPTGADDKKYSITKKKIHILKGRSFAVDLGNVPNIPPEEFFGAALWQIVKAIKSPFKSIMKFGLLDCYTYGESSLLLCDLVKKNILQSRRSLRHTDPYMLMYNKLTEFYEKSGRVNDKWLIASALHLKCTEGTTNSNSFPLMHRSELQDFTTEIKKIKNSKGVNCNFIADDFKTITTLGETIKNFILKTYTNISQKKQLKKSAISPRDINRLGRKIFTAFNNRPNKVSKLALPINLPNFFETLTINKNQKKQWQILGEHPDKSGARKIITEIISGDNLEPLLSWLVLNDIYTSKTQIKTDLTSYPVRSRDIKTLLNELKNFLLTKKSDDEADDIAETDNPERIKKGFFTLNLTTSRDQYNHKQIFFTYLNNWGELFCIELKPDDMLKNYPEPYLKEHLHNIYDKDLKLNQFIPEMAECSPLHIVN